MATKRVELQWVQNVQGLPQLQQLAKIAKEVEEALNKTTAASKSVKTETDAVGTSAVASAAKWAAATAAVTGYLATLKAVTVDSALYAARTQTLTVVTANLARVNNINQAATFGVVEGLKKQGITTQEALGTVNKMIFAQLDLAKAQNVARVAQDAAVIAGLNSSQALEGIIHGIVTRQPEVLRTYGIVVNFEAEFTRASQKLGRQLTDQEKIQIALNAALREGGKIAGTYEAAMTTTGKQLSSLTRHVQEAKNAVGEQLQPALGTVIHSLETMAKFVQENAGGFANLGVGITAASAAAIAFRIPAPLPFKIGAAAIAGIGTFALGEQDQKKFIQSQGQDAITALGIKRDALKERLSKGELTPKDADAQSKQLDSLIQQIKAQTANDLAKLFLQRGKQGGKDIAFEAERIATGVDLGRGVKVSAGEVLKSIKDIRTGGGDITGPLVNQKLLDEQQRQALADQFALKAKAAQKAIQEFYLSSLEKSTDDLQTVLARFLNADNSRTTGFGRVLDKTTTGLAKELEKAFVGSTPIPGVSQKAFAAFNNEMAFAISKIMGERFEKRVKEEAAALAKSLEESGFTDTTKKTVGGLGLSRLNQDESLKAVQALENQAALGPLTRLGFKLQGQGRLADLEGSADVAKRIDEIKAQAQISSIQRQSSFSTSLVNLGKGQGDDVSAILKAAAIRVKAAQDQFEVERRLAQLTGDSIKLEEAFYRKEESREQARLDAATQLLELRKRERDEFKQGGERLFDAFKANGTRGIGDFFKTQFVDNTLRTVSGNAAGLSFDFFKQNRITLPGQGTAQNPNVLGKLLQGTPFGLDPLDALKNVNLKQIDSTNALRVSIDSLNGTIGGSAGGGRSSSGSAIGSIISSATGIPGLGSLGGLLGPGGTSGFAGPVGGFKSSGSGLAASSIPFDPAGVYSLPKTQSTQSSFSKGLGTAAQVGSGALLAVAGIRQGGARGTLTAIGGGLQAAAAIPGPQQPFLQAGALIAGFIGSILPDPRKIREQTIDRILEGAKFDAPVSKTREVDLFGRAFDYDSRGAVRIIQNNNFQALDARSLVDRRHDIADMVSMAAADGHSIVQEFKSQIAPQ